MVRNWKIESFVRTLLSFDIQLEIKFFFMFKDVSIHVKSSTCCCNYISGAMPCTYIVNELDRKFLRYNMFTFFLYL